MQCQGEKYNRERIKLNGHNSGSGCTFKLGGQGRLHSEEDYIKSLQPFQSPVPN